MWSGALKPDSHLESFWEAFWDCDLYELDFSRYNFTWWNGQGDIRSVEERLDRFCANTKWSLLFLKAKVTQVDFDMSDLLPILLRCQPVRSKRRGSSNIFRFEHLWYSNPSCLDIIKHAWGSYATEDVVDNLVMKLDVCSTNLAQWNRDIFGNVRVEIRKLEAQLKGTADARSRKNILTSIGEWRKREEHESMLCEILMPCDVEAMLDIPLCDSWPSNKLVWHFTTLGDFTVRSAYHLILNHMLCNTGSSPNSSKELWRKLWGLEVCLGALPTECNIAKRVLDFNIGCAICGASEDSDVHALLHCPLARMIREGSKVDSRFWHVNVRTMVDCFQEAMVNMGVDEVGEFLATLEHQGLPKGVAPDAPVLWKPPAPGCFKLNFDSGKTGASGQGCGIVIKSCDGDIIFVGVDQAGGFTGPEVEEASACLFGLKCASDLGLERIVVEGDFLPLIQKPRQRHL
ncbi:hypothetical protein Cgig2_019798 [Carnegiea gigantea]|uniref:RNase H type-1 domain-containing protein n=1 Tax=Carnegiea gigantea TaxID=171969 RepID=A0A9Q1JZ07_9CARY|nr:hypothetical protein Cgig2_019798 [Carnegiea gigantea]